MRLEKFDTEEIDQNKGLIYSFPINKPEHLSFSVSSSFIYKEDTNIRLFNKNYKDSQFSFRLGNNGLIRVNENQVLNFYNETGNSDIGVNGISNTYITDPNQISWINASFLFDYTKNTVRTFQNGKYVSVDPFYNDDKVTEVDSIMIYNLKGKTVSFIKDVKQCTDICDNFNFSSIIFFKILNFWLIILSQFYQY